MFRISSTENAVTSITINGQTYNFKDIKSRELIDTIQTLLGDGVDGSVVASDTEPDGEGVKIWINTNELVAAEGEEYYNKAQTDALLNGIRAQIGNSSSISIDDSNIDETKTWSSQKISQELQHIVNQVGTGGATIVSRDSGYNYEYVGTIFPAQDVYQSWPIAGVQYDKELDKIICLVTDADGHSSATKSKITLYSVNPQTSEISEIKVVKEGLLSNPNIFIHPAFHSQRGFLIDNDTGIYYKFHFGDDKVPKACKSIDKGVNWEDIQITETNNASILSVGGNGQIIKTSNGRIICGLFGNGFAYTDDFFEHLTYVTSGRVAEQGASRVHEYDIIELEQNKLVAICRYSWNPTATDNWSANSGDYRDEKAWITYSTDNGTSWTYPVTTDMRMTATNCCSFKEGNFINLYVGTRFFADGITTFKNGMYYLKISKEDLLNNNLSNGELMFYGNSQQYSDFGNLACCTDCRGNLHLFYNDGKETKTCRWHYIKASKTTVNNSKIVENPTLKEVQSYNAKAVDSLIASIYEYINFMKSELLIKIGELPDAGTTENPTYWVSDGLSYMWQIDEAHFSEGLFIPVVGDSSATLINATGDYNSSASTEYKNTHIITDNNTNGGIISKVLKETLVNNPNGYTIEFDFITNPIDSGGYMSSIFFGANIMSAIYVMIPIFNTTSTGHSYLKSSFAFTNGAFDDARKINTFTWSFDRISQRAKVFINGNLVLDSDGVTVDEGYSLDIADMRQLVTNNSFGVIKSYRGQKKNIRIYNRPLTDEELLLNANYSNL